MERDSSCAETAAAAAATAAVQVDDVYIDRDYDLSELRRDRGNYKRSPSMVSIPVEDAHLRGDSSSRHRRRRRNHLIDVAVLDRLNDDNEHRKYGGSRSASRSRLTRISNRSRGLYSSRSTEHPTLRRRRYGDDQFDSEPEPPMYNDYVERLGGASRYAREERRNAELIDEVVEKPAPVPISKVTVVPEPIRKKSAVIIMRHESPIRPENPKVLSFFSQR